MRTSILVISFFLSSPGFTQSASEVIGFNNNWKFYLGDTTAGAIQFDDSHWRTLDLPHDWSIEGKFDSAYNTTTQGGALPGGIGWYRKKIEVPHDMKKFIRIEFDGIYRNSEVWINGHYLGKRPNGYISFQYDLTPYIQPGTNILAVRVDNSQRPDSRWYTGAGIYRNVRLVYTNPIAVDHWGTFITTPRVTKNAANVHLAVSICNKFKQTKTVRIETKIYNAAGKIVATNTLNNISLKDSLTELEQNFTVQQPTLWSTANPYLYKAVTKIYSNTLLNECTTPFGIRYFNFDIEKGFSLNGKPMKIYGVCNHHDLGALGAAVNTRAIERQLRILKNMGCNAIRTAHNPPAPELLDLCDKMGFIVMVEAFDMWKKRKNRYDYHLDFDAWHQRDLEDMVKRDRNHPSVFMWSIGNEIREQFDSTGIALTRELTVIVKSLDTTRPVTAALTETDTLKNFIYQANALDLLGLNYNHAKFEQLPGLWPGKKIIASETTSGLASRGQYDMPSDSVRYWPARGEKTVSKGNADFSVSSYDNVAAYWGSTHEATWKKIKKLDYISGIFVWTGFDYLGEPTPYPWPARSSYFGIVDLAGFPKDIYYMYQSEWTTKPVLHLFPHWNWQPGQTIDVWAYYNNADEVELFLNNRSLGKRKKQNDDLHVQWSVSFEPGTLTAVSLKNGKIVLSRTIKTAAEPARIKMTADRQIVHADGRDLVFVTIEITDAQGNPAPLADNPIDFHISGQATILCTDNGYQASTEPFKGTLRNAYRGKCLVILQTSRTPGTIQLTAKSGGLVPATIALKSQ
jgi:beta-galactosidase